MSLTSLSLTRRALARTALAAVSLTALTGALGFSGALPAAAQTGPSSNPQIYSPVLLGSTSGTATNNWILNMQASPTGGSASVQLLKSINYSDFSWNRFGSGRCFLYSAKTFLTGDSLTVSDETGLVTTVLNDPSEARHYTKAVWSPDGTRVAWVGGRFNPDNPSTATLTETGIYVGDVTLDGAGNPLALVNVRQIVSDTYTRINSNQNTLSWTGDQQHLIYRLNTGVAHGSMGDLYRVAVNVLGAAPERINIGNIASTVTLATPKASPVPGDGRIAFAAFASTAELWTVDVPTSYNAAQVLTAKKITKGSQLAGAPSGASYDWSPDGTTFAFTQYSSSGGTIYNRVLKIPSVGGTASIILSSKTNSYTVGLWRN